MSEIQKFFFNFHMLSIWDMDFDIIEYFILIIALKFFVNIPKIQQSDEYIA
jgi:hypothetical protein